MCRSAPRGAQAPGVQSMSEYKGDISGRLVRRASWHLWVALGATLGTLVARTVRLTSDGGMDHAIVARAARVRPAGGSRYDDPHFLYLPSAVMAAAPWTVVPRGVLSVLVPVVVTGCRVGGWVCALRLHGVPVRSRFAALGLIGLAAGFAPFARARCGGRVEAAAGAGGVARAAVAGAGGEGRGAGGPGGGLVLAGAGAAAARSDVALSGGDAAQGLSGCGDVVWSSGYGGRSLLDGCEAYVAPAAPCPSRLQRARPLRLCLEGDGRLGPGGYSGGRQQRCPWATRFDPAVAPQVSCMFVVYWLAHSHGTGPYTGPPGR